VLAPFRGIRYARDRVSGIANVTSPPYDVINGGILDQLRAADPHNVVRLILPGQDADASPAASAAEANRAAAGLLREWLSAGVLIRDRMAALYIYEQRLPGSGSSLLQRGIIGLVRLGSPESAGILPHENVMPGLVAGRRELMAATQANLEPIFLIYDGGQFPDATDTDAMPTATEVMDRVADERTPLVAITTEDGITHRLWRLGDPGEQAAIAADLSGRRALIADGHHRYAAYRELQAEMRAAGAGPGPWDYGLAFLVDTDAYPLRLGPIHRVLPRLDPDDAARRAAGAFTVTDLPGDLGAALGSLTRAASQGSAFLLAGGGGFRLLTDPDRGRLAAAMPRETSPRWRALDASVMQELLLAQLWSIKDNVRDVLISHDAAEAARTAADTGGTAVICNPMPLAAVMDIAAHGEQVPRKSTSFGPKPRTGLVLRTFGS